MAAERVVQLPVKTAEQVIQLIDDVQRHFGYCEAVSLDERQRSELLEALRADLELAIIRSPRP